MCGNGCMQCPRKGITTSVHQSGGVLWYCPTSLADLYVLMSKHTDDKIRLVAGNTGKGILITYSNFSNLCILDLINQGNSLVLKKMKIGTQKLNTTYLTLWYEPSFIHIIHCLQQINSRLCWTIMCLLSNTKMFFFCFFGTYL